MLCTFKNPVKSRNLYFQCNFFFTKCIFRFLTKSQSKTADLLRIKSPDFNNISPRIDNRWSKSTKSFSSPPNNINQNNIIGVHKHKSYPVLTPIRSSLSNDYSNPAGTKTFVLERKPVSIAHKNNLERSSSQYSLSPYRPYNDDRKGRDNNVEKNKVTYFQIRTGQEFC